LYLLPPSTLDFISLRSDSLILVHRLGERFSAAGSLRFLGRLLVRRRQGRPPSVRPLSQQFLARSSRLYVRVSKPPVVNPYELRGSVTSVSIVLKVRPVVDWNKGKLVEFLLETLGNHVSYVNYFNGFYPLRIVPPVGGNILHPPLLEGYKTSNLYRR
ncbi:hypothetical protein V2J09_013169, partial [Rumex salicifolius]